MAAATLQWACVGVWLYVLLVLVATAPGTNAVYTFNVRLNKAYNLSWSLSASQQEISVAVNVTQKHGVWCGLGWHALGSSDDFMTQADFVIAIFQGTGSLLSVKDYFASKVNDGFAPPMADTVQPYPGGYDNVLSFSGMQTAVTVDGVPQVVTHYQFTRKLVTNDTAADHPITSGKMKVIWAHGTSNKFEFHGVGNANQVHLDFFTGSVSTLEEDIVVPATR